MFGFIYTLLGLGAYGKGLIKNGITDAAESAKSIEEGRPWYIDARGNQREVVSNELIMTKVDRYTGDAGYEIIDPRSKRLHTFINTDKAKREEKWKRYHDAWISGEAIVDDPSAAPITVIEWEKPNSEIDNEYFKFWTSDGYKLNKPRACRGRRKKDIETGRLFVCRKMSYCIVQKDQWNLKTGKKEDRVIWTKFDYYMDAETGMAVRLTDSEIRHGRDLAEKNKKILEFNKNQAVNLAKGQKEKNPNWFYCNSDNNDWG